MEKLKIENFAGIKSIEFEFKSVNLLIGPQGAGKSITVKLLYFFKSFFTEIVKSIDSEEGKRDLDSRQRERFTIFFPKESWPKGNFKIVYSLNNSFISIDKINSKIYFNYSDNLKKAILKSRKLRSEEKIKISEGQKLSTFTFKRKLDEKIRKCFSDEISPISSYNQFFIPAGRSFFANIQKSIFSFLSENRSLDPFLIEFGSFYENFKGIYRDVIEDNVDKDFDHLIAEILDSKYIREKEKDFLLHIDNRKVNLSNASSGQQETLPLMIILKALNYLKFSGGGATIYIEEPEAHLFPIAQKRIVQLLARTFNNDNSKFQIFVTTHSPYILSSFNNLLQAGRLIEIKPNKIRTINKIIPIKEQVNPELFTAYSLIKGKKVDLIEEDSKLITQTILDNVSNEIANQFGNLLDVEF